MVRISFRCRTDSLKRTDPGKGSAGSHHIIRICGQSVSGHLLENSLFLLRTEIEFAPEGFEVLRGAVLRVAGRESTGVAMAACNFRTLLWSSPFSRGRGVTGTEVNTRATIGSSSPLSQNCFRRSESLCMTLLPFMRPAGVEMTHFSFPFRTIPAKAGGDPGLSGNRHLLPPMPTGGLRKTLPSRKDPGSFIVETGGTALFPSPPSYEIRPPASSSRPRPRHRSHR